MARRTGSADLPLHGGRVPPWLATRMASLGAIICQAIVHHYGRDEFLRRLSHPFWFQSFGAVMGMDWHSSGITTSVIGALKRGPGAAAGRARHPRLRRPRPAFAQDAGRTCARLASASASTAPALTRASRLVAKVDSAAVQDGFDLYLHGFFVTDDGNWTVVQQGMNGDSRQARRYHWHSEDLKSFVDEPHSAIDGPCRARSSTSPTSAPSLSRAAQLDLLAALGPDRIVARTRRSARGDAPAAQPLLPHLVMPAHHDVRAERRLHAPPARHARRRGRARPGRLSRAAADARRRRAHGAVPRHGGRGRARRALSLQRSGALLAGAWRQGSPSLPGAAQGLRRDHPRAEIGGAERQARPRRGTAGR